MRSGSKSAKAGTLESTEWRQRTRRPFVLLFAGSEKSFGQMPPVAGDALTRPSPPLRRRGREDPERRGGRLARGRQPLGRLAAPERGSAWLVHQCVQNVCGVASAASVLVAGTIGADAGVTACCATSADSAASRARATSCCDTTSRGSGRCPGCDDPCSPDSPISALSFPLGLSEGLRETTLPVLGPEGAPSESDHLDVDHLPARTDVGQISPERVRNWEIWHLEFELERAVAQETPFASGFLSVVHVCS